MRTTPAGARPRRSGCSRSRLVLLAAFVAIELRARKPLVPFSIFRIRTLTGANVVGLLVGASLFSMFFFISLYMQQVLGYSAIHAGLSYLPLALVIMASAGIASQLVTKLGYKPVLAAGMLIIVAGLLWFSRVSVGGGFLTRHPRPVAARGRRPRLRLRDDDDRRGLRRRGRRGRAGQRPDQHLPAGRRRARARGALVDRHLLHRQHRRPAADLTEGFRAAFLGGAAIAFLGFVLTLVLISNKDSRAHVELGSVGRWSPHNRPLQ